MSKKLTQHINTNSYRGGQVLIQARAWVGRRIRTVSHRAKIIELKVLNGSTLEIECEWVAIKKGTRFHFDAKENPIMTVEIGWLEIDNTYSMIINYREDDISQTYSFMEHGHEKCIRDTRVIGLKNR